MVRFGVSIWSAPDGPTWRDEARRFEQLGYETVWVADHVGMFDPFAALVAAASVTERLRVGTYVLNIEFWNPLLLARVAATTHLVTDGRLILGLGAGHAQVEFEQAGLDYPPPGRRVDRLEACVPVLRRLLAGETVDNAFLGLRGAATGLAPAASPPPLLIGGNGDRVLTLAGREADMVSLVGFTSGTGQVHSDLSHWSWDGLAERLAHVRAAAGDRPIEVDILVQRAAITDDPAAELADFTAAGIAAEKFDSPFLLVGPLPQVVEDLRRLDALGVDAVTVFSPHAAALGPAIAALR
jgi:probable F420-dependent oxidoreductase